MAERSIRKQGSAGPTRERERLFSRWLGFDPFAETEPFYGSGTVESFVPAFDVKETRDGYMLKADLPGLEDKDLEVNLSGNRLTVSGKRESEKKEEGETTYSWERTFGTFTRSFVLPEDADVDHVAADLKNGVLTLAIGRKAELRPRRIEVKGTRS